MAILGGAGNVAGGNPAGTGTSLNYIGDHAYAYSGPISSNGSSTADTVALQFSTGNSYIVGYISFQTTELGGGTCFVDLKINDQVIMDVQWDNDPTKAPDYLDVILPPYSDVTVLTGTANDKTMTAQITGRVYA